MIPVPKGYNFAATQAGFKKKDKLDLGVVWSDTKAKAAACYTKNLFQAACITYCKNLLKAAPYAWGIVGNSGQANACTGQQGIEDCEHLTAITAKALGLEPGGLLPASTGVIGARIKTDKWEAALPALAESKGKTGPMDVAKAIMTTDTFPKLTWKTVDLDQGRVTLMGMTKGAGMISPNMATMLGFVFCDADVDQDWWQKTLSYCVDKTFNHITVDGDTSTNDTVMALANGAAKVTVESDSDREKLADALMHVCKELSFMIVMDAEGGTKTAAINVVNAKDQNQAELVARAVGNSPLVKTALFGQDANWGRIVAAAGRSGAEFDPDKLVLKIGGITLFENGQPVPEDLDALLAPVMKRDHIIIEIDLADGDEIFTLTASDLTDGYIRINADYRT